MAVTAPVRVEPMRAADIPDVLEIERLSFSSPWPAYAFEQELGANRLATYLVARSGRQVVGFAGVWRMVDEAHITTFGVHPGWRRRGVGSQLLLAVVDLALGIAARRLTLEVRAGNTGAQALYESFGFEVRGRRIRYYTDDGEDALVMTTPDIDSPSQAALIADLRRRIGQPPDARSEGRA